MAFDFNSAKGAGTDQIDNSILGMPLLNIVQSGSPQVKPSHKDYATKKIPGCVPGDIVFAPTNSVMKQPLQFIPLASTTLYTEWKPKNQGGGFLGNRPLTTVSDPRYKTGIKGTKTEYKEYLGDNELQYTIFVAGKFLDGDKWKLGFLSFNATSLKPARNWLKAIKTVKVPGMDNDAPIFSAIWNLGTKVEQNAEGDWMGWSITMNRVLDATADEALLVASFEEHATVQKALPSPERGRQAALPTSGEVTDDSVPY